MGKPKKVVDWIDKVLIQIQEVIQVSKESQVIKIWAQILKIWLVVDQGRILS